MSSSEDDHRSIVSVVGIEYPSAIGVDDRLVVVVFEVCRTGVYELIGETIVEFREEVDVSYGRTRKRHP